MQNGLESGSLDLLVRAVERMAEGFSGLDPVPPATDQERILAVLNEAAERMRDNFPYFHPLYAGQMLKPPHTAARLAYMLAMYINPNNHALDGGRASSAMEKEAVAEIASMFGWSEHLGHLTGGGTMANLEALWVAGRLHPGKMLVASSQAHYTHERLCGVLGIPFRTVPVDGSGRMDPEALEGLLREGGVGTVVATVGTTAAGAADPLPELVALRETYGFRLHADAAYGGYFTLAGNLREDTRKVFDLLGQADSIVVDPHKHGMQPYGCGCILFRDPSVGRFYKHDSPYTYFSSTELHLGEISLECSRPGASAVALWVTQRLMPLVRGGELSANLEAGRRAALELHRRIAADGRFVSAFDPELDIVIWAPAAGSMAAASELSRKIFTEAGKHNLHLAVATLPAGFFRFRDFGIRPDSDRVTCLRSVLMKPEHEHWIDRIWEILDQSSKKAGL